ncbi:MAG: type II toxin-antitoxin system Phd/YefM family antitoxin [Dongiaceae bacterium]
MAQTRDVPATEFSRNFARYREEAISEKIIHVTSHGRVIGAYLSASEAEHYEKLKRRERQSFVVGDLPKDVVAAIESAEYGADPK